MRRLLLSVLFGVTVGSCGRADVVLRRLPGQAIQPQVALDQAGRLHLLVFRGEARAGDLYYTTSTDLGESWARPVRVNSTPGSAIAAGNVRGGHLALGRDDRPHVSWMGSERAEPRGPGGAAPMLYTRLADDGTRFEPERNVMQYATGLDGGGTVAADRDGRVYVVWHANPDGDGEQNRRVYVARSDDDGATFAREQPVNPPATGCCGCCSIRAFADPAGTLYINYRGARETVHRDAFLLVSTDHAASFAAQLVDEWEIGACPMSTSIFTAVGDTVLMTWEARGQVSAGRVDATAAVSNRLAAPGEPTGRRRYPVAARNRAGETLLAWAEGMAWQSGGAVCWQVFGPDGRPGDQRGRADGVPPWSLIAAVPTDDGFVLLY